MIVKLQAILIKRYINFHIMYVQVIVPYKAGPSRTYYIRTPSRKDGIKCLARRRYKPLSFTIVNLSTTPKLIITEVAINIKSEVKDISSNSHGSVLKDTVQGVKHFSWETITLEILNKMPTLMLLPMKLVPQSPQQKALLFYCLSYY